LGIAAGLHEYARQSDIIFMANYAQTVNVIGCIKTTKTAAEMETTGLVLQLYRAHFGTIPVAVQTEAPLDVAAALTADGKQLTIGVVNPTLRELAIPCQIAGVKLASDGMGKRWQIAGPDPQAYNHPGQPRKVDIQENPIATPVDALQVAPCSITLFALPLAK
jgi:alpha-N-arabinofuranosidase